MSVSLNGPVAEVKLCCDTYTKVTQDRFSIKLKSLPAPLEVHEMVSSLTNAVFFCV
jgi:hypothetical protein